MAFKQSNNSFENLKKLTDKIDKSEDPLTKGFIKGKLDPTKFESVYGLCDQSSSSTANHQCITYVDAIIMSYSLGKRIKFFQENGAIALLAFMKNKKNLDLIMLAKKFINVTLFSAYQYPLFCGQSGKDVLMATLVIPSLSFFNHSCCPNAIRTHRNGDLAIIAIRPIKEGEQVFANYGALWFCQVKEIRHNHLERLQFTCNCEACEGNWSIPEDLDPGAIIENKSFTHGGPCMNKELLGIITKYDKVCFTAIDHVLKNNRPYPVAGVVTERFPVGPYGK
ncbi:hypothetical protein HCN44_008179 [Aphidius gifuensis]|uniref:SET domain-containing protein n=1 Tax=Aphidius gifuensis TaxID=684658 RepID=A0A834XM61_APHGI|nr:hypothetical protein HCN44_008179 [Aphidius gifuensis]